MNAPAPQELDFNRLPRVSCERFVASLVEGRPPAPVASEKTHSASRSEVQRRPDLFLS